MRRPPLLRIAPALLALALLTVAPARAIPESAVLAATARPALRDVSLLLKWRHQFQFAGYYVAQEKGFYRDAGLRVTIGEETI